MNTVNSSDSKPAQTQRGISQTDPHRWLAARIAGAYMIAGLLWIGLSDLSLAESGGLTAIGFRVSASKGALFVLLSTGLVFWLCRREYRNTLRSITLLRAVVEGTSDAVFVKDRDGKYLLLNTAGANFIGKPVAEVLGRDDRELFQSLDGERLMESDRAIMASGGVVTLEETLTSSGITRTYQATKAPFFDSSGEVAGLIGISRDATDRTQIESALRETDARLREAQRIARLGSWAWEPPTDHVWWSDAEFELFGMKPMVLQPSFKAFLDLLHPEDRPVAIARVDAMLAGANEFANDLRVIRADGSCIWIHSQARATRDADGRLLRVEGTDQDITAVRQAREALEESELRLQAAIELAQLGIIVVDYQRQEVKLSPRAAEQFGLPSTLAISRAELHERFHLSDKELLTKLIQDSLDATGAGNMALEHRVIRPDGTIRWLNVRKQVSFSNGQPSGAVVVTADVTARREAEVRLREQEMLVREAAELAKVGGWGFDPFTLQVDWTPEVARMYGLPEDEPPKLQNALDFFAPQQRPMLESALTKSIEEGLPHDLELQLLSTDGEKKWVRTICRPIVENGQVVRVRGSLQDITDRKRVESELRAGEERYRMLFESNPYPMWVFDVKTLRFLEVNDAAVRAYGYTHEEFLQMTIRDIRPLEDVPKLEVEIARTLQGFDHSTQWRHQRKDGSVFEVEISSHDLPGEHRHSRLVLALDVTDRRRAEAELQASERRLRLALEAAGAIAFVWEVPNDVVTRYFSKEPALPATAEKVGTLNEVRSRVHSADLSAFDTRLAECLAHGKEYYNEYRVVRPDGSFACLEDYGYLDRNEDGSPLRLTGMSIDVTERVAAIDSVRRSEERLRVALKGAKGGVWDWNLITQQAWWSPEMYDLMGGPLSMETNEIQSFDLIHPDDQQRVRDAVADAISRRGDFHCEFRVQGGKRWLSSHASLSVDEAGNPNRMVGITWDITDRRQLEEQFRQSQKMEAVGRLAGGVAHDFNNLLTVINGYCEIIISGLAVDDPTREALSAIHDAGDRAARLTKQLLALSRKSMVEPKLVDLNELVAESVNLLRRLIGEDITLLVLADPTPVRVFFDPGQVEQILMNLVVNARDAMPSGGRLTIETRTIQLGTETDIATTDLAPGQYALLRVTDTGCGIANDIKDKIFEPFFTTKGVGKGTGLGLAVVHGVVQQSGGSITVDSTEGVGTRFNILLPLANDSQEVIPTAESHSSLHGRENVLVVEDEDAVRTLIRYTLEDQGYTVLTASSGSEALDLINTLSITLDLLVTDMIMPGISGRDLADKARQLSPRLRVIYLSGYTDDALSRYGLQGSSDQFMQKPFTPLGLVRKVRSILDQIS